MQKEENSSFVEESSRRNSPKGFQSLNGYGKIGISSHKKNQTISVLNSFKTSQMHNFMMEGDKGEKWEDLVKVQIIEKIPVDFRKFIMNTEQVSHIIGQCKSAIDIKAL